MKPTGQRTAAFCCSERIKNSISHKTIFGYSLCALLVRCACMWCDVMRCVAEHWYTCMSFLFHIPFLWFSFSSLRWPSEDFSANMLSNVRALDIFERFSVLVCLYVRISDYYSIFLWVCRQCIRSHLLCECVRMSMTADRRLKFNWVK